MTRNEFFDIFEQSFFSNKKIYCFDIYQTSYNNSEEFQKKLIEHFSNFFISIELNKDEINKLFISFPVQVRFNDDYIEEYPDSDLCLFNCSINLHILYYYFVQLKYSKDIKNTHYNSPLFTTLYRIEQTNGQGLYSGFFAGIDVNLNSQPSPNDDPLLNSIFNSFSYEPSSYTKKWSFGFATKEDTLSWINDSSYIEKLHQKNFVLNEITVPSYFVIQGQQQLIFQKEYVVKENHLPLDNLINDINHNLTVKNSINNIAKKLK